MNIKKEKRIVLINIFKKYIPCLISECIAFIIFSFIYMRGFIATFSITDWQEKVDNLDSILDVTSSIPGFLVLFFTLIVFVCAILMGLLGDLKVMKCVWSETFNMEEDFIDYTKINEMIKQTGGRTLKVTKLVFKNTKLTFYTRLTTEFKSNDKVMLWIDNNSIYPKIIHVIKV